MAGSFPGFCCGCWSVASSSLTAFLNPEVFNRSLGGERGTLPVVKPFELELCCERGELRSGVMTDALGFERGGPCPGGEGSGGSCPVECISCGISICDSVLRAGLVMVARGVGGRFGSGGRNPVVLSFTLFTIRVEPSLWSITDHPAAN